MYCLIRTWSVTYHCLIYKNPQHICNWKPNWLRMDYKCNKLWRESCKSCSGWWHILLCIYRGGAGDGLGNGVSCNATSLLYYCLFQHLRHPLSFHILYSMLFIYTSYYPSTIYFNWIVQAHGTCLCEHTCVPPVWTTHPPLFSCLALVTVPCCSLLRLSLGFVFCCFLLGCFFCFCFCGLVVVLFVVLFVVVLVVDVVTLWCWCWC